MVFHNVTCEVCRQFVDRIEDLVAYQLRDGTIHPVDLKGQQPWSGVRCVCGSCIESLVHFSGQVPSPSPREPDR